MPKKKSRKYNQGGVLRGPSHARGGMPAIIGGKEPVELEGGEYIIRKSSVDKYGEGTIARINQGLVDPGKLRQLKKGGKINKLYQSGGGTNQQCPPGQHWMPPVGGNVGYCMQGNTHPGGGYKKGGRIRKRRYEYLSS